MARLLPKLIGPLALLAALAGCAANGGAARGPFPRFAEYDGYEVARVTFAGDLQLPVDSLREVAITRPSRCRLLFLPICIPGTSIGRQKQELDLRVLAGDITRLHLYYRDHGYYGGRVVPSVDPMGDEKVAVRFAIAPGDQVILRELAVDGAEGAVPQEELRERLSLTVGEPFSRIGFLDSADSVRLALLNRGYAYADVLRNYAIDTIADVAEVQFVAIPGPLVYVDSVVVLGEDHLDARTVRRQMTFREGDLLRLPELARSQRNLYSLEMVSFASIELADDSLQANPDTARATVVVRLVESAQYGVDASLGFGTIDCIRSSGSWVNRNFLGGGRRLQLTGSLAKIGVGEPLDASFDERVCARSRQQAFDERVNYRAALDFRQPRLLNTRNQLNVNVHSERFTELDLFLRESSGAQATLARDLGPQTLLTATANVENGLTIADPIVLCVGFETCTEEDIEALGRQRWSNSLSVAAARDGSQTIGVVTRGYQARVGADWASGIFGSDNEYLRLLVDGAVYRPLRPGWVVSANLRAGRFVGGTLGLDQGYIPPELRFYAGGPNSVRGFERNALGPVAYVERPRLDENGLPTAETDTVRSATGGTQMLLGSLELRMPSPYLGDLMRLATFVDAGHVSVPGEGLGTRTVRFTPGAGLRFITPIGPIRLDVAYNAYPEEAGPLFSVDPRLGLIRIEESFQPESPGPWSFKRFQLQFAVGQAF